MAIETEKLIQKHLSTLELRPHTKHDPKPNKSFFDSGIFYTVADIASKVGCSTRTIERCIKKGELKSTKVGKKTVIHSEWLESWLQP